MPRPIRGVLRAVGLRARGTIVILPYFVRFCRGDSKFICVLDRLGLKFCINRRSAVFLADFPTGGVARALRALGASDKVPQGPLQPTWLRISDEEDWAAWEARICDLPSHPPGPLLAFEVVYLALSDDSKVRWLCHIVVKRKPLNPIIYLGPRK